MLGALLLVVGCGVPEQVHFAFRREGPVWVAGHDTHRVEVDAQGRVRFFPIADREVGPRRALTLGVPGRPRISAHGATLSLERGGVVERLENGERGLAQSFHFARRPAGPVAVELAVDGAWQAETVRGHHFAPGVAYGPATWIAADGVRVALKTERTKTGLRIRVPDEVVARGPYPAVLDPLVSPEIGIDLPITRPPPGQQDHPAVAFDGTRFLVAWRDFRGGVGSDIYGARVEPDGGVLDPGGLSLSVTGGGQYEPALAFGGGQYYLTFSDTRAGGSDIYGMRVTPAGASLDGTGIPISSVAGLQVTSDVSFNGTDYVVVWSDLRASPTHIYGARVSQAGVVLDPNPNVLISNAINGQYTPKVASTDAGASFVVWEDTRAATSDIYGAFFTATGTVNPATGIAVTAAGQGQRQPDVAFDGTNFLAVWSDSRGGNPDVYGGRVSQTGAVLDGLGFPIGTGASAQDQPAVAASPSGGGPSLVAWRDDRGGTLDVYGARVSGALLLDATGFAISTASAAESEPAVAAGPAGAWLAAFTDGRNGNNDIFAARVGSAGTVADPLGLGVNLAANLQQSPVVATDGNGFLLVWQDYRDATANIYAALADTTGLLITLPFPVSQAPGDESAPAATFDGTNYVVAWQDARAGNADVYAARVTTLATVLDPAGIPVSAGSLDERTPSIVARAGTSFVVWQDLRSGGSTPGDIYGARVNSAGTVLDATGIPISTASGVQANPDLTLFALGYLVVWQDGRNANDDIYGARVMFTGMVQDPLGIAISLASGAEDSPSVAASSNGAFVVWRDTRNGATNGDIFGTRFTSAGLVVDTAGLALSTAAGQQTVPEVGFDPATQTFAVFWEDARVLSSNELYGIDVDSNGITSTEQPLGSGRTPALVFAAAGPGVLTYAKFESGVGLNNLRAKYRYVSTVIDAGAPDAGAPDAGAPDAGVPDAGIPDAGVPDAGIPDAGVPDAGVPDAGVGDAGTSDGGVADAGLADAGTTDAGTTDAGTTDAGTTDAGTADAGTADAGTADGGLGASRTLGVGCGCGAASDGAGLAGLAGLLFLARIRRRLSFSGS